jgi:hypothetical protein
MKRVVTLVGAALLCLAMLGFVATGERVHYDFAYDIGDTVTYDNNTWEITSLLEQKAMENGKIYPYYRLTREVNKRIIHMWSWACPIDNGDQDSECCTDPPPCPSPPGDPC